MAISDELDEIRAESAKIEAPVNGLGLYNRTLLQVQEMEAAVKLYRDCEAHGWPFEGPHRRIFDQHIAQAAALGQSRAFETPEGEQAYEVR